MPKKSTSKAAKQPRITSTSTPPVPATSPAESPTKADAKAKPEAVQNPQTDLNETLTAAEEKLRAECEEIITQNLTGFLVVGQRLCLIRDKRLYRATHKSFEPYCRERWDFSKTHINRFIAGYTCVENLKSVTAKVAIPVNESHARVIADLKPDQQVEVAKKVLAHVGEGRATAKDFKLAKAELFPVPETAVKPHKKIEPAVTEAVKTQPDAGEMLVTFDTKLVPLAVLKKHADNLYNIFTNSARKQEALKLIGILQRELEAWADWQADHPNATNESAALPPS